ncbi:DUF885 domain-containing protein [Candidatus Protofrankia californiensis]|uniref:DUF885 domain-containing protein n=1 Tax=Candidatus Protofrankia californiensis TaxID=1839754 RepID=UPI0019D01753|nr:DUF885 domain-containing protein [Candidatus Protofrankia californiensis]
MLTDPRVPRSDRPLDRLVAGFAADQMAAAPTSATLLGVDGYDHLLPELTTEAVTRREKADDDWAQRFGALDDAQLRPDELIDRDLVLAELRGRAVMRDWERHRRDAELYGGAGLSGVFGLLLYRPLPPEELVRAVTARLSAVGDLLAAGRAQLDAELASPLLLRRAAMQARGGVAYCRDVVPTLLPGAPGLVAACRTAADAYEEWTGFLEALAARATGRFAIGEARYSALLREKEGLSYGADGLLERGRAAHTALVEQVRDRARELAGHDDWRAYLRELDADAPATPEDMLAGYREATERARRFIYSTGLVTEPPGERCEVEPAEEFQRATLAVAFYFPPRPFASGQATPGEPAGASFAGHFFVPYPPSDASPEAVRDRLAANSYSAMSTVAVHEAYPGHHWHLAHLAVTNQRPVRGLLRTPYFVEGWALYAEQLLADAGYFTDARAALRQVDFRLFRAARIVADVSLHTGRWSVEQAVEYMSTHASLTPDVARAEVARYCAWPTQAASYLTGALEIARMRDAWLAAERGSLREFHDRLAATGGLPIMLAERALSA